MAEKVQTTFFVAPNGDDEWSGKLTEPNGEGTNGPFATVARARDAIRAMPEMERVAHPIIVMLREGTYFFDETLVFEPQDSGTFACPITYAAYPGETPVLSGGRRIEADWRLYGDDTMVCTIPEAEDREWMFRRLMVNDEAKNRARLPDDDYYRIEESVSEDAFHYHEGDLQAFHNLEDVEAVVFHSWNESRLIIEELDEDERVVTFTEPPERSHYFGWRGPNRYYLENVRDGLTQPGDWYLDYESGELYYWPEEDLDEAKIVAPVLEQLVRFEAEVQRDRPVEYLRFQGLNFCDTNWPLSAGGYPGCGDVGDIVEPSALGMGGARRCSVENCHIKNTGTYALEISGSGNTIVGNRIHDTGSGGIITRNLTPEHTVVAYNHIHDCGAVYPSAVGINIDDGGGIFVHNLIHDISHSGIYARHWATAHQPLGRRNQEEGLFISYNEIHRVMKVINDGAGIFVRDANMLIRNNLIHDVYSYGEGTPGWGIYLGCRSRDSRVENNLVYRTRESVHIWYGNENTTWINNVFVDGLKTQINYTNAEDTEHVNVRFLRNVVCWDASQASLFVVRGERSLPEASDYNVFFQTEGADMCIEEHPEIGDYDAWRERGYDTHSVVRDPLFVDPAQDNYDLAPGSPALELGFEPLDLSTVGLRGSRWDRRNGDG